MSSPYFVARTLMGVVLARRPDLYAAILQKIRPYSLESVLTIFGAHLRNVKDLRVFNDHLDTVPQFVWAVIQHMKLPTPGEAIGILLVCRVTKSDTQGALDSKHPQAVTSRHPFEFHVEKEISEELALFSSHSQLFELANRHKYATVFMDPDTSIEDLMARLPRACVLERGQDYNKGRDAAGSYAYLNTFRYVLVEDRGSVKVLYRSLNDLYLILRRVPLRQVAAFSDVRCLFKKCGITCTFFNMMEIARRQLFVNDHSQYEKDVTSILTFMFCRGELLPMNREGLAKTKDRPPIDVVSFEAMKRNCSRIATGSSRGMWHEVKTSSEKIFCGSQFNEGTGYCFEITRKKGENPFQKRTRNQTESEDIVEV